VRVTNQMSASRLLANLNALRSRTASLTDQVSSGNRITRVSEDPTAAGQVMQIQSRFQVMAQWEANLTDTRTWLRTTEASLDQMTGILSRAKELGIAGANSATGEEARTAIAPEMQHLLEQMVEVLNGQSFGGALFAGFQTDSQEPFALDNETGVVTYSGNSGAMQREIGPGVVVTANLDGARLDDWSNPNNMLSALWQTTQDLKNLDYEAVSTGLANLDRAIDQVLTLRSEIGSRERRLDQAEARMQESFVHVSAMLEQAQGVDMAKAILELSSAETTYRAALQVGARIIPPTLVDFLR
jgi:flagellar hook-associated protein 3 FlgL